MATVAEARVVNAARTTQGIVLVTGDQRLNGMRPLARRVSGIVSVGLTAIASSET